MPKIKCICGNVINLGEIPNKNEYLFISDFDYDKVDGNINSNNLYDKFKRFYECISCKRLYFYWSTDEQNKITIYKIES